MEWACRVRQRGPHRVPASPSHPGGPCCAQGSGLTLQGTPRHHRALPQERGERTQGPQRPLRSMSPVGTGRGTYYRGCGVRGAAGGPGPRGVSGIVVGARGETEGQPVRGASHLRDQRRLGWMHWRLRARPQPALFPEWIQVWGPESGAEGEPRSPGGEGRGRK